jgi:hypothetical protein
MLNSTFDNETSQSAIKALLYYDIFNYPLTSNEIFSTLSTNHTTEKEIQVALNKLCEEGYIYKFENFYCVQNNEALIERRKKGNQEADKLMHLAQRKAKFIHLFPFVRSVMASGSLSKNYMDDKSDLDFFVITAPGRLWIARMLLILYKRIFLLNSHKHFCINYFVDEDHLEIEEKNIFTATELATLIPLAGKSYYPLLFQTNKWISKFLPNHPSLDKKEFVEISDKKVSTIFERILNFFGADHLDTFFMNLTFKRWKRVYEKKYSPTDFQIAFKTKKHVSKNHPNFYQKKIVDLYKEKLNAFAKQANIQWLHE